MTSPLSTITTLPPLTAGGVDDTNQIATRQNRTITTSEEDKRRCDGSRKTTTPSTPGGMILPYCFHLCTDCWSPERIEISAGASKPAINIMDCFCFDEDDPYAILKVKSRKHKKMMDNDIIILPPELYPPNWDDRVIVETAIIKAAALQGHTQLLRTRSDRSKCQTILGCVRSRRYYHSEFGHNPSNEEIYLNSTDHDENNNPNSDATYKPNIRLDRMVNKSKASRGLIGKNMEKRTVTTKPPLENLCKFSIILYLLPGSYWYVKRKTYKEKAQHNHMKLSNSESCRKSNSYSPEELAKVAMIQRFANSGAPTQNIMSNDCQGFTLSKEQIHYHSKKREAEELGCNMTDSTATKLLAFLRKQVQDGKMRYIALMHEVTGTTLLAISKRQCKKDMVDANIPAPPSTQERLEQLRRFGNQHDSSICSDDNLTLEVRVETSVANSTAALMSSFFLKNSEYSMLLPTQKNLVVGQKILLVVAWCREDERALFDLYPEVLQLDVTHGTNKEDRPLALTACPGPGLKYFTPLWAFLPSQCQWVFEWMFATCLPVLLGKESLQRTQLVLTDGDSKIYNAFGKHQRQLYPHATHGLCIYHLVNRGLEMLAPKMLGKDRDLYFLSMSSQMAS